VRLTSEEMRNELSGAEARRAPAGATLRYLLAAAATSALLFGVLRSSWMQVHALVPYALAQQRLAGWALGMRKLPVVVGFSCTGTDVISLCLGAILVFPAPWRRRLAGAGLGLLLISLVNTIRIGNLSAVASDPALFRLLHVFVWPAALILLVCGFVYLWMLRVSQAHEADGGGDEASRFASRWWTAPAQFAAWTVVLVVAFVAAAPWYLESDWLRRVARWAAISGGAILSLVHAPARVADNVLSTAYGSFVVTTTCMASPLIPVYLAAALAFPRGAARRALWLLAAPFVFFVLGTVRLLVLAVPSVLVESHSIAIHAFNQLVFGALLVALAAAWSADGFERSSRFWLPRWSLALALAVAAALLAGVPWGRAARAIAGAVQSALGHGGHGFVDEQDAAGLLPAFQIGLLVALATALWRRGDPRRGRLFAGAALLLAGQIALYVLLGECWTHGHWVPHVRDLRALAVAGPLLVAGWLRRDELVRSLEPSRWRRPVDAAG